MGYFLFFSAGIVVGVVCILVLPWPSPWPSYDEQWWAPGITGTPRTWELISADGTLLMMAVSGDTPPIWCPPPDDPQYIDPNLGAEWVEEGHEATHVDQLLIDFREAGILLSSGDLNASKRRS